MLRRLTAVGLFTGLGLDLRVAYLRGHETETTLLNDESTCSPFPRDKSTWLIMGLGVQRAVPISASKSRALRRTTNRSAVCVAYIMHDNASCCKQY